LAQRREFFDGTDGHIHARSGSSLGIQTGWIQPSQDRDFDARHPQGVCLREVGHT
jgi:hypothetical protein